MSDKRVVSVMLRCLPDPASDGFVVGQAEVIDTGELVPIRRVDDLVEMIQRLATSPASTPGAGR
jgi:hypothetical protein